MAGIFLSYWQAFSRYFPFLLAGIFQAFSFPTGRHFPFFLLHFRYSACCVCIPQSAGLCVSVRSSTQHHNMNGHVTATLMLDVAEINNQSNSSWVGLCVILFMQVMDNFVCMNGVWFCANKLYVILCVQVMCHSSIWSGCVWLCVPVKGDSVHKVCLILCVWVLLHYHSWLFVYSSFSMNLWCMLELKFLENYFAFRLLGFTVRFTLLYAPSPFHVFTGSWFHDPENTIKVH